MVNEKEFFMQQIAPYVHNEQSQNILLSYCDILQEENKKYDLTAISTFQGIVFDHLVDSLRVTLLNEFKQTKIISDIGTGAGAPGLILAMVFPEKHFYCVEISQKRINFLEKIINEFNITNCTIVSYDFKTVIRKAHVPQGSLFMSRATLSLDKLLYMFGGASSYHDSQLIYWGTNKTHLEFDAVKRLYPKVVLKEEPYVVNNKQRSYIIASDR